MFDLTPTFPPLLSGHGIAADQSVMDWAKRGAQAGTLGAGDFVWSKATNQMRFALVLEPEVKRYRCAEIVYVALVAFGDAAGALIPPEVAITYQWPNVIQMNDGQIGMVDLVVSEAETDGIPDWMVLDMEIKLTPDFADMNPGENYHRTTMWDEGCGEITCTELLESTSRHLVNLIHTWTEDGFKPIHELWQGRISKEEPLTRNQIMNDMKFLGVDEIGNGLLITNGQTQSYPVADVLNDLRVQSSVYS